MLLNEMILRDDLEVFAHINNNKFKIDYVYVISRNPEHQYIKTCKEFNEVISDYYDSSKNIAEISISVPNFDNIPWGCKEIKGYETKLEFNDGEKTLMLYNCGGMGIEKTPGSGIIDMEVVDLGCALLYEKTYILTPKWRCK